MPPEQKAQINKRRHELYAAKNTARKLQMTSQEKKLKQKEINKKIQYDGERTPSQQSASGLNRHGEPSL